LGRFADEFLDGVGGEEAGGEEAFAALEGADLGMSVLILDCRVVCN
jgi:hypothetical protein